MYLLRLALWTARRRTLATRLAWKGASSYEVVKALREDVARHPHPTG